MRLIRHIAAQPLYVSGLPINGVAKKVLYVVTRNNKVYAFDTNTGDKIWKERELRDYTRNQGAAELPGAEDGPFPCDQLRGPVGITSTPVIDASTNIMYVVYRTGLPPDPRSKSWSDQKYTKETIPPALAKSYQLDAHYWLAAIDIRTGEDRHNPVEIEFQPKYDQNVHLNRPGLLLLNGIVYIGFGAAVCDHGGNPWLATPDKSKPHGLIFAYRGQDLKPIDVFNTTKYTALAGIWQSGSGLASDANGNIYVITGNNGAERYDDDDNTDDKWIVANDASHVTELGESILKLRLGANKKFIRPAPHFTAGNWFRLDTGGHFPGDPDAFYKGEDGMPRQVNKQGELMHVSADADLGSGGAVVLSNGLVIGGGKQGRVYVIDPNHMERVKSTFQFYHTWNPEISPCDYDKGQEYGPNIHGAPVAWHPATVNYSLIYGMPEKEYLKVFRIYDNGTVEKHPTQTTMDIGIRSPRGMPGAALSLSADGGRNGILWASVPTQESRDASTTDGNKIFGRLLAFDAQTLELLWEAKDKVPFAKFVPPTIADGKVFRVAYKNEVVVYGLEPGSMEKPPRTEAFVKTRLVTALWRDNDHLDLFVSSQRGEGGDVLSTNWEAVCPSSDPRALASRGWRGWFPVATLVYDEQDIPPGMRVTVAGSQPVTAVKGDPVHANPVNVFVTNKAGHVMSNFWRPNEGWHAWFPINPSTGVAAPGQPVTAVWRNANHLDLFITNNAGKVMSTFFEGNSWDTHWFEPVPGAAAAPGQPVTAVWRNANHLDLFITNNAGKVMSAFFEGNSWDTHWFEPVPGAAAAPSQPVTAVWSNPNHLYLFVTDQNGKVIGTSFEGNSWQSGWFFISPSTGTTAPDQPQPITAVSRNRDHVDLFMTDKNGRVLSTFWESQGGWREWFSID